MINNTLNIIHLGPGNIGTAFIKQFFLQKKTIEQQYALDMRFVGLFGSHNGMIDELGLDRKRCMDFIEGNGAGSIASDQLAHRLSHIPKPFVLIDTTASEETISLLQTVLKKKGYVISSNKKPFTRSYKDYALLTTQANHIFFETTVGAGLPIISTIRDLLETGDIIEEIHGCFSGTLGFIFTRLAQGMSFSAAVLQAKQEGYTEPDPRDDLSGTDVARKALILNRLAGSKRELKDMAVHSLIPHAMNRLTVVQFMKNVSTLDGRYHKKVKQALLQNKVLKYVARIAADSCSVGLQLFPNNSDIGSLKGPDNIVVIKSKRYHQYPLVIKGPGAGMEVTAAGVFADLLKIVRLYSQ